jgi:glycosyltransferase involved in cell wall biosynthesis
MTSRPILEITCLSHLAFERGLFQRPQQLMTQFVAMGHRVRYIGLVGAARYQQLVHQKAARGRIVPPGQDQAEKPGKAEPGKTGEGWYLHLAYHPSVQRLRGLREWFAAQMVKGTDHFTRIAAKPIPVTWIYHPDLVSLARRAGLLLRKGEQTVVYDIMDRFPAFGKSGKTTADNEKKLINSLADFVIAGGASLFETASSLVQDSQNYHRPVLLQPSAVDHDHFAKALDPDTPVDPALAQLSGPILGYFGAIDERIDWPLLIRLAQAYPQAQVALVGPVLIPPKMPLPNNLHLLGPRSYSDLPGVAKGFSVALIPFVDSDLTRHVSPTKAPEYLAAGRPVVSTAIPDIIADWGEIIPTAQGPEQFVQLVGEQLNKPNSQEIMAAQASKWPNWSMAAERLEGELIARILARA